VASAARDRLTLDVKQAEIAEKSFVEKS